MTLANPDWLWALLVLPLLWWLSRPPRPRQQLHTAHLAQWQAALAALRRRPPRGAPLRFVLLALAVAAVALAASGPSLPAEPGPRRLFVLLDGSLSMAASSGDNTAFARARELVVQRLHEVPEHVDVTLLRCGGTLLRRHGAAARAGMDLGTAAGTLTADLPALARQLAASDDSLDAPVVWTLTDGQGQKELPDVGALDVFADAGANAALLDVRLEDAWPLPELYLTVDVVAFVSGNATGDAASPAGAELQVQVEGAVAATPPQRRQVPSGAVQSFRFDLQRTPAGGAMRVAVLLAGDRLAADDAREVLLPPLPAPRIAVLATAEAGPFVQVAAEALAEEVRGQVVAANSGDEVGLLLVDGGEVAVQPGRARVLTFGSQLAADREVQPWLGLSGIDWAREHPLTRGLDLSELRVDRALRRLLPAGEVIVWADGPDGPEPLAVAVDGPLPSVHFACSLRDSNLPLLAAFPQLLRRAFVWSHGAASQPVWAGQPPPPGEQDLAHPATSPNRPLPQFGGASRDLAGWLVLAGLLALALRAWVR